MKLAKPHLDVAVMTNDLEPMLAFWQNEVGLAFEEAMPTGGGNMQHRHAMNGSVFKLNHSRNALPEASRTGIALLSIAQAEREEARSLSDPDGNGVRLVPRGEIAGIGVRIAARDLAAQQAFYRDALQLEEVDAATYLCGDSRIELVEDPAAPQDPGFYGRGYRYLTLQVDDCEAEHARILESGAREGMAPLRMGDVAIFSMVLDPAGIWIEISQRASLTGPLA
jgi:lactoylglutathione lyase